MHGVYVYCIITHVALQYNVDPSIKSIYCEYLIGMKQNQELIIESPVQLNPQTSNCENFGHQICNCGYCHVDG
jgi:hypothetical protein